MDERVIQFRVGVLVVATAIITVILIVLFGELPPWLGGGYRVHVQFAQAPRVGIDTPVRKNGILIGRVTKVTLQDDGVLVTSKIMKQYSLRTNEICRIGVGNLFGDAVMEFVLSDDPEHTSEPVRDGDFLQGQVAKDPLSVLVDLQAVVVDLQDDVARALTSMTHAGDQVGTLAGNLNSMLENNQDLLVRVLTKTESALTSIDRAATTFNQLAGDPQVQQDLRQSLALVPQMLSQASDTLHSLQRMSESAETNLRNIESITRPLGERGHEFVVDIEDKLAILGGIMQQLHDFSIALNSPEGSLGQLVHDGQLYERINSAAANIEAVSVQLRPIINDVRIFTDKIARDPRQLGVRGALDRRRSGLKSISGQFTEGWR